jgi:hypothetical protein
VYNRECPFGTGMCYKGIHVQQRMPRRDTIVVPVRVTGSFMYNRECPFGTGMCYKGIHVQQRMPIGIQSHDWDVTPAVDIRGYGVQGWSHSCMTENAPRPLGVCPCTTEDIPKACHHKTHGYGYKVSFFFFFKVLSLSIVALSRHRVRFGTGGLCVMMKCSMGFAALVFQWTQRAVGQPRRGTQSGWWSSVLWT